MTVTFKVKIIFETLKVKKAKYQTCSERNLSRNSTLIIYELG